MNDNVTLEKIHILYIAGVFWQVLINKIWVFEIKI